MKEVFFSSCKNMTSIENSSTKLVISGWSNWPTKLQYIPILMYTKLVNLNHTSNGASSFDIRLSSFYFHLNVQWASQSQYLQNWIIYSTLLLPPHTSQTAIFIFILVSAKVSIFCFIMDSFSYFTSCYFPVQVNLHLLVPLCLSFIPWIIRASYM